jgi:hypothetical protein
VDPGRVRLQLRLVRAVMSAARPADRAAMRPRAVEILQMVAMQIESDPDPALVQLLAEVRDEVQTGVD